MDKHVFTVIVGDLFHSRSIEKRNEFRNKLHSVINSINDEFSSDLYAPLRLTRGVDELSGVLYTPNVSFRICRTLNYAINPLQFRFAIVRDTLDVALDSHNAGSMDGPAFHIAANLIENIRHEKSLYQFKISGDSSINLLLNNLTKLIQVVRSNWTEHQRDLFDLYMENKNQKAVAKEYNITQQAVSAALKKTHWQVINIAEESIDTILEKM